MELLMFFLDPGKHKHLTVFKKRCPRPDAESIHGEASLCVDTSNYFGRSHRPVIFNHMDYVWDLEVIS